MQLDFTPEQEAALAQMARVRGIVPEDLVLEAASQLFRGDAEFRAGVKRGLAAAERGEFLEDSHVWKKVEAILES